MSNKPSASHLTLGLEFSLTLLFTTDWAQTIRTRRVSQVVLVAKNPPASAGVMRGTDSIPGSGRSPGAYPLQYACLQNPMDRGAWWATVHRVTKSQTGLKRLSMYACMHKDWSSFKKYELLIISDCKKCKRFLPVARISPKLMALQSCRPLTSSAANGRTLTSSVSNYIQCFLSQTRPHLCLSDAPSWFLIIKLIIW